MEELLRDIRLRYEVDDYMVDEELPKLIANAFPRLRKNHTLREIADLMGIPYYLVIKYGKYGTNRITVSDKERIKKRDGFKCRKCGLTDNGNPSALLHVHHINSARDNRKSNLITVCNFCHQTLHKMRRDNKMTYMEFINSIKV